MARIESRFYTAEDVCQMLGLKKSSAYKIIKQLNTEWEKRGKLVVNGKVNKTIFDEFYPQ